MVEVEDFQLMTSVRHDPARPWLPSLLTSFPQTPNISNPTSSDETKLQSESPIFLVLYHRDRLSEAAGAFGWSEAAGRLAGIESAKEIQDLAEDAIRKERGSLESGTSQSWKIRPLVSRSGDLKVTVHSISARPFDLLYASSLTPETASAWLSSLPPSFQSPVQVHLDTEPTPRSLFTSHKTSHRDPYDDARRRLDIEGKIKSSGGDIVHEVVLYNEDGEITEGSFRNVCFWKDGRGWVSPPNKMSGGIGGTVRRWMIEQGRVKEGVLRIDELREGDWVLLSNGVEGCSLGKFVSRP